MRPGSIKWTTSEEVHLRELVAAGKTAKEAGKALGRHMETARRKAITMGLTFARDTGERQKAAPEQEPKVPPVREPVRYSSRMAMMMGDPPIGRSALDKLNSTEKDRING